MKKAPTCMYNVYTLQIGHKTLDQVYSRSKNWIRLHLPDPRKYTIPGQMI